MYKRSREELNKFIKKPYQPGITDEIIGLYSEVERLEKENADLKKQNDKHLAYGNSPKYKLADAIEKYLMDELLSQDAIKKLIKEQIMTHLKIDVETDKVSAPYDSGWWYESDVTMNWK